MTLATNRALGYAVAALIWCITQQAFVVAAAQEQRSRAATVASGPAETAISGTAEGKWSPALTGVRHPLYRLSKSDVLELSFTFAPEFSQTVSVQPDGFITLKGLPELYAEGATVPELQEAVRTAYTGMMNDPEVTIILKDFDKPYFVASGQVAHPGKYELRADTTVTEAVAMAGGFTEQARHSQVVLFRRASGDLTEARLLNLKQMLNSRNLREDMHLQPGDMIFVPQNAISKIRRYLPASSLSLYSTPTQF